MSIYQEIRDAIAADPALQAMQAEGNTQGIADALSAGRTKITSKQGGIGAVLRELGPTEGAAVLDALDAVRPSTPALKWAWYLIERGELDFGDAATRGMIAEFVAGGVITQAQADGLLAIPVEDDPITHTQVARAIKGYN